MPLIIYDKVAGFSPSVKSIATEARKHGERQVLILCFRASVATTIICEANNII